MSDVATVFSQARSEGRLAFMPFVTAGDPDLSTTAAVIDELTSCGADLIEVGFPYSDPIADGPVIQAGYARALTSGVTVDAVFELVAGLDSPAPLVGMVSYSIVFRYGVEAFVERASTCGFSGLIVPDLPGDEAAALFESTRAVGLDLVQLIALSTTPDRCRRILESCSGFVYCVAVSGTTGERDGVETALLDHLKRLREQTSLPLAVGFGISKPEHVTALKGVADGVIVGSAIVRRLAESASPLSAVSEYAAQMIAASR